MIRLFLHVLMLLAMLVIEGRSASRLAPGRAAAAWYALGLPLFAIEAATTGPLWKKTMEESLATALFFLLPAYAAFWYAARNPRAVLRPFFLFAAFSVGAFFVAGFVLARTPLAFGGV